MRVLVVEDEPRMSMLLQRGFREEGYAVDAAADGTDGLRGVSEAQWLRLPPTRLRATDLSFQPPSGEGAHS